MPARAALLALVLAFGAAAATAGASVMDALDLRELVARSEVVVVATCVDERSSFTPERRIVTDVTLRVEETLAGGVEPGGTLVVRRLGGAVGDLGMRVEGEASFEPGQRSLVFATRRGGHLRAVGMSQGVMQIRAAPHGAPVVQPGGGGLSLVERTRSGRLAPAPAALLHPTPLEDVLRDVRRLVNELHGR